MRMISMLHGATINANSLCYGDFYNQDGATINADNFNVTARQTFTNDMRISILELFQSDSLNLIHITDNFAALLLINF